MDNHVPVLLNESIDALNINPSGIYIDGTFGRGGHSAEIVKKIGKEGKLFVLDKDPQAISTALDAYAETSNVVITAGSYTQLEQLMQENELCGKVDGILLDLGVSSPQLDNAQRGFSFMKSGFLDMRMDNEQGQSAAQWLNQVGEKDLIEVLKVYGEERYAKRIARAIIGARNETKLEVYERLGRVLQEDFYVREFSIYEINNEAKNKIVPVIVDGIADGACKWCDPQIMIRADACRAKRTGHVIDSIETPHICNYFDSNNQPKQHLCLPIIQSGTVGSVVQIVTDADEAKHYQDLIPFMQPYLREASPVIETKRLMATLKESNLRDAMTGLNNRRFLEEYVDTMVANANRNNSSISILMLDLDYFKKVNDTYGHDIGDKVLIELAKVLVKSVRSSDMVIRYGGEEFLIILQNTNENFGDQMAEKIRLAVEEMKVQVTGAILQKTISIGVADFPDDSDTFWQALKYADVALYQAKDRGRNQFVHFSSDMWKDGEEY